jgi:RNA polymerase sigma-70 factor (ECF subfamily)
MATDEDLAGRLTAGDGDALRMLVERWDRPLRAFLTRHGGDQDVDDLAQETWLHVVRAAVTFDPRRRFSTWLFQIALNCRRDSLRRRRDLPLPPERVARALGGADPAPALDARLDAARLLATLPDEQRSALVLRYYHDLGEDDVAAVLGCPRGTVKSRLHHAVRKLVALAREHPR